jgi:hypothetical protein
MADRKILQIMPAAGWAAIYNEDDDELVTPLVGWALVQAADGTSVSVVGLAAAEQVELCDDHANFLRYAFVSELIDDDSMMDFDDDDDEDDAEYDPTTGLLN